jgi:DNA repair exonuclease SbcCD nuclease subunit
VIKALKEKGFEQNNKNHTLIIAGDVFDRGKESNEIKEYLSNTNNKVCVIGNHELLLIDVMYRGFFQYHDLTNGTIDAAIQLSGGYDLYPEIPKDVELTKSFRKDRMGFFGINMPHYLQERIIKNLMNTNILEWLVDNFYNENEKGEKLVS